MPTSGGTPGCIRGYAIFTLCKLVGITAFLMYLAVTRKSHIEDYYDAALCGQCYTQSKAIPQWLFEFGKCGNQYLPDLTGSNLLVDKSWFAVVPTKSNVHWYLLDTIFLTVLVLILAMVFPIISFEWVGQAGWDEVDQAPPRSSRREDDEVSDVCVAYNYTIGVITAAMLMYGGLEMSELYLETATGCFVSPYLSEHLAAVNGLIRILVVLLVLETLFMCIWPKKGVLLVFNIISGLTVAAFAILAFVMVVRNLTTTQAVDYQAAIITCVGILHLIETPLILCCCLPRKKDVDFVNL